MPAVRTRCSTPIPMANRTREEDVSKSRSLKQLQKLTIESMEDIHLPLIKEQNKMERPKTSVPNLIVTYDIIDCEGSLRNDDIQLEDVPQDHITLPVIEEHSAGIINIQQNIVKYVWDNKEPGETIHRLRKHNRPLTKYKSWCSGTKLDIEQLELQHARSRTLSLPSGINEHLNLKPLEYCGGSKKCRSRSLVPDSSGTEGCTLNQSEKLKKHLEKEEKPFELKRGQDLLLEKWLESQLHVDKVLEKKLLKFR